uniref:Uncharacterized protein n=1 Tax=Oryza sativa subsp. japonica TaxID=39947 RepID=Q6K7P9_ORYSJ|nr:hypothetical protein [Oryza sativa Japonica Group]
MEITKSENTRRKVPRLAESRSMNGAKRNGGEVWGRVRTRLGLSCSSPSADFADWWLAARKSVAKVDRKTFDAGVILVTWLIWKERNARVFEGIEATILHLCSAMGDEWETWIAADCSNSVLSERLEEVVGDSEKEIVKYGYADAYR